jgi:hypothetical protein
VVDDIDANREIVEGVCPAMLAKEPAREFVSVFVALAALRT